ncbi:helix-turn-helix domain-containing protein [Patescibacteria group bacterium]|nr:helix-turn-helix domain-containing protein [Patescibacteria group bacterium]MCG2701555.1 helix-turn-helix domain-containing protein [Candidatus Parcubacteria bacterium]MBU4210287.1 helix-turn-helix domain-containing protein [Patescibacteria group bacterium]MBU4264477.1 helix-turn-helix domain-containing protein [Patescibacteria group bacterium]MBU4390408.1 helix-turn-helix domain-containing protein [Patescibacteria group bacterium]
MFQASSILKNAREDRELSLKEVSEKLKIPEKYLKAIEEADFKNYPKQPYCSLFVKEYADLFGLNSKNILSFFRRDSYQPQTKTNVSKNQNPKFFITPQKVFSFSAIFVVIFLSLYLVVQYLSFNRPPKLSVNWPDKESIRSNQTIITGQTDPEATVRINDDLIITDDMGNFSKKVDLTDNQDKITITSTSHSGKSNTKEMIY